MRSRVKLIWPLVVILLHYPEIVDGDVHGCNLDDDLLLPERDFIGSLRCKQQVGLSQVTARLATFLNVVKMTEIFSAFNVFGIYRRQRVAR